MRYRRYRRPLTKREKLLQRRLDQAYTRQRVLLCGISETLKDCYSLDELNWLTAIIDTDLRSTMERCETLQVVRDRFRERGRKTRESRRTAKIVYTVRLRARTRKNPKPQKTAKKSAKQK
jgi:hypothetical protein